MSKLKTLPISPTLWFNQQLFFITCVRLQMGVCKWEGDYDERKEGVYNEAKDLSSQKI